MTELWKNGKKKCKIQHKKNLYKLSDTVPVGIYFHMYRTCRSLSIRTFQESSFAVSRL